MDETTDVSRREQLTIIIISRFACLRCTACERYAFAGSRPSGVSKITLRDWQT